MNAYAVVNPLLEAIYYFKMKANGETQAQVLDRVLKKRITTAGEITDFFGPAFELEKLLDEGIVLRERRHKHLPCNTRLFELVPPKFHKFG